MDFKDWIRTARKNIGWTQEQLGEAVGRTKANIGHWETGKHAPSAEQLVQVSQVTGYPLPEMGAPRPESSNVAEAPALAPSRRVPVVGHVKGGVDGFLEEMQFPVGHGEGFVEYWTKDSGAYALRVRGDSMSPRYRAREFIVVTPGIEALPGTDVVVKLRDGRKLLKHLNWIRDDEIQLISINDGYEPMTLQREEIESIHRVAGGVPADAFQENRAR